MLWRNADLRNATPFAWREKIKTIMIRLLLPKIIYPEERNTEAPIRTATTGAAGQISYAALFRIANGIMLGQEQPIILQLLDLPQAQTMLRGVMMELEDCAFPLLQQIVITDDPKVAFRDTEIALLIGARPRGKGMERKDLIEAKGASFSAQGKLLNEYEIGRASCRER